MTSIQLPFSPEQWSQTPTAIQQFVVSLAADRVDAVKAAEILTSVTQDTASSQAPFSTEEWSQTPEGIRLFVLSWIAERLRIIRAAMAVARQPRTPRHVVFISDLPRSREVKLAYGLSQAGWQVTLLYKELPTFDATRYFADSQQYQEPWEALKLAACYTPVAYHVFSNWNFNVAATLIRYKPGKIVFDDYDVMAGVVKDDFLHKNYPGQLELERSCLENADGLCCRGLELQYAKRHLNYNPPIVSFFFRSTVGILTHKYHPPLMQRMMVFTSSIAAISPLKSTILKTHMHIT